MFTLKDQRPEGPPASAGSKKKTSVRGWDHASGLETHFQKPVYEVRHPHQVVEGLPNRGETSRCPVK